MDTLSVRPRAVDESLRNLVRAAQNAREHAITVTSSVGIAYETWDGRIYTGFNIQTHGRKMDRHAEEVGLDAGLRDGSVGTDYRRMVEIFADVRDNTPQIFPACNSCWTYQWEFTHPYMEIITAKVDGEVVQSNKLGFIYALPWEQIYPNNFIRGLKDRKNTIPRLSLADDLKPFYETNPFFKDFVDALFRKGL